MCAGLAATDLRAAEPVSWPSKIISFPEQLGVPSGERFRIEVTMRILLLPNST